MDFSEAQTLTVTFKTFAVDAGAVICLGGLIFAGIRMMTGRFQDSIPASPSRSVFDQRPNDSIWASDNFRLDAIKMDIPLCAPAIPSRKPPSRHGNSGNDWAWICDQLAHGKDAIKLTRELACRRSDKPNPAYYAQRTVHVASARLWLLEGIRIDDVITTLEGRRRFEIPTTIAGARAREIATTAERMNCPQKVGVISVLKETQCHYLKPPKPVASAPRFG